MKEFGKLWIFREFGHGMSNNFFFTITVKISRRADWLVAIVYKSADNKNDVKCKKNKKNKQRRALFQRKIKPISLVMFHVIVKKKTSRRKLSMVYTLVDHKMFKTW